MKELLNILPDRQLSLSEFVDAVNEWYTFTIKGKYPLPILMAAITNYNDFLKQPLELRMLVPCDEEGEVLKFPIKPLPEHTKPHRMLLDEYQKAKERVLYLIQKTIYDPKMGAYEVRINGAFSFFYKKGAIIDSVVNLRVTPQFWKEALGL